MGELFKNSSAIKSEPHCCESKTANKIHVVNNNQNKTKKNKQKKTASWLE